MGQFSIHDLAEFSGIKQHTIRIWEQRYSFLAPQRASSTHRTYTAEELNVFLNVVLLNQNGLKISRIDRMSLAEKLEVLSKVMDQQQKAVHDLIICMAKMDGQGFDGVLKHAVLTWGIHDTLQQILLPFCDMVGLLENSSVKKYAENILLVRQSIKGALYAGIAASKGDEQEEAALLFLPPGEVHEFTLLYLHYMLQMNGIRSLYLAQVTQFGHLELICRKIKPRYIVTHCSKRSGAIRELVSFIEKIPGLLPRAVLLTIETSVPQSKSSSLHMHAAALPDALEAILQHEGRAANETSDLCPVPPDAR
jgi:DNA-binding transcriptional MerR regulator